MRGEGAPQQPRAHSVAAVHHQHDLTHRASPLSHVDASPEWQGQYPYPAQGAMGYMPESMHRSASPVSPLPQLLPSYGRAASPMVATHLLSPATTTGVKHVSTPSLVRGAGSPQTMQGHNGFRPHRVTSCVRRFIQPHTLLAQSVRPHNAAWAVAPLGRLAADATQRGHVALNRWARPQFEPRA